MAGFFTSLNWLEHKIKLTYQVKLVHTQDHRFLTGVPGEGLGVREDPKCRLLYTFTPIH
jgi:hypothetical protein